MLQQPLIPDAAERLSQVEAVLFDLDGTLIDTVTLILESFRHTTRTVFGEQLDDLTLMAGVGKPLRHQMHEFDPERAEELMRVYREFNSAHHDEMVTEYPGTHEVLTGLAERGVPLGVVTSKGTPMTKRGLELFGLDRYFPVVVTADDVEVHKPDPYPLAFAADLLGIELEKCAYIGDSPHDMEAALGGGAVSVAALWGAFTREDVLAPGPDFAIERMSDLPALLAGDTTRSRV